VQAMDRTTQSTHNGGMHPSRPSPLSYSFQQEELSNAEELYGANEKQMKNRSCLPGYPTNQRSSTSNSTNINSKRTQHLRSSATVRSNHRDVDTLLTDEIFMMDHLAIASSTSMPIYTNMNVQDNRDLYRNHRDRNHSSSSSQLMSSRGTSQNRRSRHMSSSISRSATAALATPRSSSISRGRGSTYHHNNNPSSASQQQHSNSTASTGSRYNYPNGVATSASPSKRSSSRISFSSQLSSTTTAPSIHDIDDNGTVSTKRSENSVNHRQYNNHRHHHKPPSPMTETHVATIGKSKSLGKNISSNQSTGSTTTKSSSGTNAMGNTKAMTQRRNAQSSALSSTPNPSPVTLDVDTMKNHVQETRRVIDGK
jgi:hypothetical protein